MNPQLIQFIVKENEVEHFKDFIARESSSFKPNSVTVEGRLFRFEAINQQEAFNVGANWLLYKSQGYRWDKLGHEGPGVWRDPNRGPVSEWENGTQILHPVLIAREGEKEAEIGYYCDVNEEWKDSKLQRIDDVVGWWPFPSVPTNNG